jgi:hypothetical protein
MNQSEKTYRHDLLQVAQGGSCHADGSILVTWHNGWSQELLVTIRREVDIQSNAVVHSETHELAQSQGPDIDSQTDQAILGDQCSPKQDQCLILMNVLVQHNNTGNLNITYSTIRL